MPAFEPPDSLLTMARRRRRGAEPPAVRPFDVDGVRTVAVGTVLWAIAFVVLALLRDDLVERGVGWWLWTCLAGVGLGLLGLEYTRKRRDAIARARLREEADRSDDYDITDEDAEPADLELELVETDVGAEPHLQVEEHSVPAEPQFIQPQPVQAAEPRPVRAEPPPVVRPEPPPPVRAEPPRTVQAEPPPAVRAEPPQATAPPPPPSTDWAEIGLLDVGPPIPAPTASSRRARRREHAVPDIDEPDFAESELDEPLLPMVDHDRSSIDGRSEGGRRRRDESADEDEISDGGTVYRGRRARRP
jgi:Protein of unknown function (DUF2530)